LTNGWTRYEVFVTEELKRLSDGQREMNRELQKLSECVTLGRIKLAGIATILGLLGGFVPLLVAILLKVL